MNQLTSHFSSTQYGKLNLQGVYQTSDDSLMYPPDDLRGTVIVNDDNLLKLKAQYCWKLMLPVVNRMIGSYGELNKQSCMKQSTITGLPTQIVFFVNHNADLTVS